MLISYRLARLLLWLLVQYLANLPAAFSIVVGDQPNINLPHPESSSNPTPATPNVESTVEIAPHPSSPWPFLVGITKPRTRFPSVLNVTGPYRRPQFRVQCDEYPLQVDASDCRQAYRLLPPTNGRDYSFGNRSAERLWDVPLPMRYIGRK